MHEGTNHTLVVIVGLPFEARLAARISARVICSGSGRDLSVSLARAITNGCQGLISLGVAGGLLPNLSAGTCVVGSEILWGTQRLMADPRWSQSLLRVIPGSISGKIIGVAAPIAVPEDKHSLYTRTGAAAVDMESHVVANAAATNGLPFAAVRVIADPAEHPLPRAALTAMRPNGTVNIGAMILSLMKHPNELHALAQTACNAFAARVMLSRICTAFGSCNEPYVRSSPLGGEARIGVETLEIPRACSLGL